MTKSPARSRPLANNLLREIRGGTFWTELKSISTSGSYTVSVDGKVLELSKAEMSN